MMTLTNQLADYWEIFNNFHISIEKTFLSSEEQRVETPPKSFLELIENIVVFSHITTLN